MKTKSIKVIHVSKDLVGGIGTVIDNSRKYFTSSISVTLDGDNKKLSALDRYKSIKKRVYLQLDNFDLVHFHGSWSLHIFLLTKKMRLPVIISPHGALHKVSLQKSKIKKLIVKYLFMKKSYKNANCIHALTLREAKDIRDYGIKDVPIAIIPNGIDISKEFIINTKLKDELLRLSNNRKIILSLSRLHVSKGLDILIDAFEQLNSIDDNAILFIVGKGDLEYENKLKEKIKSKRLESKVFLLGEMFDDNKNTIYTVADIFILPSFNEGFSLTVLEAYRQKIPVITTTGTPFSEIENIGCGLYIKANSNEIFNALKLLTSKEKSELQIMGRKGYNWICDNYSSHIINSKMESLYLWLLGEIPEPDFIIRGEIIATMD